MSPELLRLGKGKDSRNSLHAKVSSKVLIPRCLLAGARHQEMSGAQLGIGGHLQQAPLNWGSTCVNFTLPPTGSVVAMVMGEDYLLERIVKHCGKYFIAR